MFLRDLSLEPTGTHPDLVNITRLLEERRTGKLHLAKQLYTNTDRMMDHQVSVQERNAWGWWTVRLIRRFPGPGCLNFERRTSVEIFGPHSSWTLPASGGGWTEIVHSAANGTKKATMVCLCLPVHRPTCFA